MLMPCDWLGSNKIVGVSKNFGPVLNRLWTKVYEILVRCRRPFVLSNPLPDCLCHVSFRRHSPVSLEVVEKPNKCNSFLAPFFLGGGANSTVLRLIVNAIYRPPFGKVSSSSICWCPSAKPGNKVKRQNWRSVGKNAGPMLSRLWTKVHDIWTRCRRPLQLSTHLSDYVYHVSFER